MTESPNSTKLADLFADWRLLAELATGCNRLGEFEAADEYAAAAGEEYQAAKARAAAQTEAPSETSNAAAGTSAENSAPRQHKPRKPTLASVAKQASKAAIAVARYEVKPDGSIVIVTGQGEQQQRNEVDEWIAKHARAPERH